MEHQLHFKVTLQLTNENDSSSAFFKVDGKRFKNARTIKLHSEYSYVIEMMFTPPQILECLYIHSVNLKFEEKNRNQHLSIYSTVWSTKDILPTRKGEREQIPIIMKISDKGTLRTCLQAKMYRCNDQEHCAWGSCLHSIEWECNANEHRNHVDLAKETFH